MAGGGSIGRGRRDYWQEHVGDDRLGYTEAMTGFMEEALRNWRAREPDETAR